MLFFQRVAVDKVGAALNRLDQKWNVLGPMLEVVVHRDDEVTTRLPDTGERVVLPEVAAQVDAAYLLILPCQLVDQSPRVVGAAVIDEHDLVATGRVAKDRGDTLNEFGEKASTGSTARRSIASPHLRALRPTHSPYCGEFVDRTKARSSASTRTSTSAAQLVGKTGELAILVVYHPRDAQRRLRMHRAEFPYGTGSSWPTADLYAGRDGNARYRRLCPVSREDTGGGSLQGAPRIDGHAPALSLASRGDRVP